MTDILAEICAKRRTTIAEEKTAQPLAELEARIRTLAAPRGFMRALQAAVDAGGAGLIAEIKKASPSKGLIRADFDAASIARSYAAAGATCLSVLTERDYFQGAAEYLEQARAACPLPILRKDFMLETYQVAQARAMGADCILLIAAALSDSEMAELEDAALHYGLDVLVEVHDESELERALRLKTPLVGINNRNLKTLAVDLATSERLVRLIPPHYTVVCESGIGTHADIVRMQASGIYCFLVGESLMRQTNVETATRTLLKGSRG